MKIELASKKMFHGLIRVILILLVLNIIGILLKFELGLSGRERITQYFDFNAEQNVPTLYSSVALIVCAVLLYIIGNAQRSSGGPYLPWFGLALIFIYLSLDETMSLHEQLSIFLQSRLKMEGWFLYPWIIPYAIAGLLVFSMYLRFLLRLPRRTLLQFILAAALFIGGAMGVEAISARAHSFLLISTWLAAFTYTFEDLLEMLGVAIFIFSLLAYIEAQFGRLRISLGDHSP